LWPVLGVAARLATWLATLLATLLSTRRYTRLATLLRPAWSAVAELALVELATGAESGWKLHSHDNATAK
jgi:hypothetical protein